MVDRLAEDDANALLLATGLSTLKGLVLEPRPPETNMVFWELSDPRFTVSSFLASLEQNGVRALELGKGRIRAVTRFGITAQDVERAVEAVEKTLRAA